MFFHMAEYCDTLQSKEKRNREHKACLNERAILRLLDQGFGEEFEKFAIRKKGTGGVTARWNQPLMFINITKPYQFHDVVPNEWLLKESDVGYTLNPDLSGDGKVNLKDYNILSSYCMEAILSWYPDLVMIYKLKRNTLAVCHTFYRSFRSAAAASA
jgi:hypothetical protein